MNLHGFLAREHIYYGSEEGLDFTNVYFATVTVPCHPRFHARSPSERGATFEGFENSKYANR